MNPTAHWRSDAKFGVLLCNFGGPEKLTDIKPFLYNLFSDPEIIRISWRRTKASRVYNRDASSTNIGAVLPANWRHS